MSVRRSDVLVLGGGSGGYATALRAAELGKSVTLIEKDRVGGTCLHRGCVPTKALLHAAELADDIRGASALGLHARFDGVDVTALHEWSSRIVRRKSSGLDALVSARGVSVITGEGMLLPDRTVRVGDELYGADHLVLAVGAESRPLPGRDFGGRILDSAAALTLPEVPGRVIIAGGGVIGVEFASLWRSLGSEVTIIEALPSLVAGEEDALRRGLERAFRKRGIHVRTGTGIDRVREEGDHVVVQLSDGSELEGDYLLVAIGRTPATSGLGLEEAGLRLDDGYVPVTPELRTDIAGIWAVGDITRGPQLAHRGFQQGIAVAERIAGQRPTPVPDAHIPRVVYSRPELASVGITEQAAIEQHGAEQVASYTYNLAGNAKSEILGTGGSVTVVRRQEGPVLGVHLIGDRVGELITEGQLAVAWDAHPEDLAGLIHAHPTQSEALGEAFLALSGKPLHAL